jgi:lipoprotein-anchoring transpeptidase ErfK/SrfK
MIVPFDDLELVHQSLRTLEPPPTYAQNSARQCAEHEIEVCVRGIYNERARRFLRSNGKALRYGIGVGREGFTWSGSLSLQRYQGACVDFLFCGGI